MKIRFAWSKCSASIVLVSAAFTAVAKPGSPLGEKTEGKTEIAPVTIPWLRLAATASNIRLDPKERFIAFTAEGGTQLKVLELKSKKVFDVSPHQTTQSFFWAPDGARLFYRELTKDPYTKKIVSELKAFDANQGRNHTIAKYPYQTGFLTYDPRDLRMYLMSEHGGIHSKKLEFPDQRLARWQRSRRTEKGKWIAAPQGLVWLTEGGFHMRRLEDDHASIQSFDISPDGSMCAWATTKHNIYFSRHGEKPQRIGVGADPKWHPEKPLLAYAGARFVGNKVVDYDLRVVDTHGVGRYLTTTAASAERWPIWIAGGTKLVFTKASTSDLFALELSPRVIGQAR